MYRQQQQQHHSEWKTRPQPAWPGHPYHSRHTLHVHRPAPPPPVHYPPHQQHRQQHSQHTVHQPPYYHNSTGSPAGPEASRPMQHGHIRTPALVSPSMHGAVTSAPISPQTVTSSPQEDGLNDNQVTPRTAGAAQSATATAASHPSTNTIITTKPPRPYTEYTMFYQLEREFILHRILTTQEEHAHNLDGTNRPALFQNDPLMPARYRSLPLRADWYISGKSKKPTKRKHRKSHGKIGFLELTRMIAARWANVDDETRKYCKMMAAMELVKYKEDMESYNLYKERLSEIGEIPEDMKERMRKKKRAQEKKEASKKSKDNGFTVNSPGVKRYEPPIIKADTVSSSTNTNVTRSNDASRAMTNQTATTNNIKAACTTVVKLEPIAHNYPHDGGSSNLDTDMEQFITSLVRSPAKPSNAKAITPERSLKKRRFFHEKLPTLATTAIVADMPPLPPPAAAGGIVVPPKQDGDHLDSIKMMFSGIDEIEMATEFSVHPTTSPTESMRTATTTMRAEMKPSFDYWDALVESPNH